MGSLELNNSSRLQAPPFACRTLLLHVTCWCARYTVPDAEESENSIKHLRISQRGFTSKALSTVLLVRERPLTCLCEQCSPAEPLTHAANCSIFIANLPPMTNSVRYDTDCTSGAAAVSGVLRNLGWRRHPQLLQLRNALTCRGIFPWRRMRKRRYSSFRPNTNPGFDILFLLCLLP